MNSCQGLHSSPSPPSGDNEDWLLLEKYSKSMPSLAGGEGTVEPPWGAHRVWKPQNIFSS